ncbi:SNF2-related protein [Nocardia sp. XZ_19_231]|uniref:SNF2-related protein n=1 Tax=Nocardia sp. XZ_19_231 TaxID=2769252 RepID=UPI00188F7329|nr:SNF2-related protein [Nocardia sp. XZ_19_231]
MLRLTQKGMSTGASISSAETSRQTALSRRDFTTANRLGSTLARLTARRDAERQQWKTQQSALMALEEQLVERGLDPAFIDEHTASKLGSTQPERWRERPADAKQRELLGRLLGQRQLPPELPEDLTAGDADTAIKQLLSPHTVAAATTPSVRPAEAAATNPAVVDDDRAVVDAVAGERREAQWNSLLHEIGEIAITELAPLAAELDTMPSADYHARMVPEAKAFVLHQLGIRAHPEFYDGEHDDSAAAAEQLLKTPSFWAQTAYTIAERLREQNQPPEQLADAEIAHELADAIVEESGTGRPQPDDVQTTVESTPALDERTEIERQSIVRVAVGSAAVLGSVDWNELGRTEFDPDRLLDVPDPDQHPTVAAAIAKSRTTRNSGRITREFENGYFEAVRAHTAAIWNQITTEVIADSDIGAAVRRIGREPSLLAQDDAFQTLILIRVTEAAQRSDLHRAAVRAHALRYSTTRLDSGVTAEIAEGAVRLARQGWSPPFLDAARLEVWRRYAAEELASDPLVAAGFGAALHSSSVVVFDAVATRIIDQYITTTETSDPAVVEWLRADLNQHIRPGMTAIEDNPWSDLGGRWKLEQSNVQISRYRSGGWAISPDSGGSFDPWGNDHRAATIAAHRAAKRTHQPTPEAQAIFTRVDEAKRTINSYLGARLAQHEFIVAVARSEILMRDVGPHSVSSNARHSPLMRSAVDELTATVDPSILDYLADTGIDVDAFIDDIVVPTALRQAHASRLAAADGADLFTGEVVEDIHVLDLSGIVVGDLDGANLRLQHHKTSGASSWKAWAGDHILVEEATLTEAIATARYLLADHQHDVAPDADQYRFAHLWRPLLERAAPNFAEGLSQDALELVTDAYDAGWYVESNPIGEHRMELAFTGDTIAGLFQFQLLYGRDENGWVALQEESTSLQLDNSGDVVRRFSSSERAVRDELHFRVEPVPADLVVIEDLVALVLDDTALRRVVRDQAYLGHTLPQRINSLLQDRLAQLRVGPHSNDAADLLNNRGLRTRLVAAIAEHLWRTENDSTPPLWVTGHTAEFTRQMPPDLKELVTAERRTLTDLAADPTNPSLTSGAILAWRDRVRADLELSAPERRPAAELTAELAAAETAIVRYAGWLDTTREAANLAVDVVVNDADLDAEFAPAVVAELTAVLTELELAAQRGQPTAEPRTELDTVINRHGIPPAAAQLLRWHANQRHSSSQSNPDSDVADNSPAPEHSDRADHLEVPEPTVDPVEGKADGQVQPASGTGLADDEVAELVDAVSRMSADTAIRGMVQVGDAEFYRHFAVAATASALALVAPHAVDQAGAVAAALWATTHPDDRLVFDEDFNPAFETFETQLYDTSDPDDLSVHTEFAITVADPVYSYTVYVGAGDPYTIVAHPGEEMYGSETLTIGEVSSAAEIMPVIRDSVAEVAEWRARQHATNTSPDDAEQIEALAHAAGLIVTSEFDVPRAPGNRGEIDRRYHLGLSSPDGEVSMRLRWDFDGVYGPYRFVANRSSVFGIDGVGPDLAAISEYLRSAAIEPDTDLPEADVAAEAPEAVIEESVAEQPGIAAAPQTPDDASKVAEQLLIDLAERLGWETPIGASPNRVLARRDEAGRTHLLTLAWDSHRVEGEKVEFTAAEYTISVGDAVQERETDLSAIYTERVLSQFTNRHQQRAVAEVILRAKASADINLRRHSGIRSGIEEYRRDARATAERALDHVVEQLPGDEVSFRLRDPSLAMKPAIIDLITRGDPARSALVDQILDEAWRTANGEAAGYARASAMTATSEQIRFGLALPIEEWGGSSTEVNFGPHVIGTVHIADHVYKVWFPNRGTEYGPYTIGYAGSFESRANDLPEIGTVDVGSDIGAFIRAHHSALAEAEAYEAAARLQPAITLTSGPTTEVLALITPTEQYLGEVLPGSHEIEVGGEVYILDEFTTPEGIDYQISTSQQQTRDDGTPHRVSALSVADTVDPTEILALIRAHHRDEIAYDGAIEHARMLERTADPEFAKPAKADEMIALARANGWSVNEIGLKGKGYSTTYELALSAQTGSGWHSYRLHWEVRKGYLSFLAARSAEWTGPNRTEAKLHRPRLNEVLRALNGTAIQEPQAPPPQVAAEQPAVAAADEQLDMFATVEPAPQPPTPEIAPTPPAPTVTAPVVSTSDALPTPFLVPADETGRPLTQWVGHTMIEATRPDGSRVMIWDEDARRYLAAAATTNPAAPAADSITVTTAPSAAADPDSVEAPSPPPTGKSALGARSDADLAAEHFMELVSFPAPENNWAKGGSKSDRAAELFAELAARPGKSARGARGNYKLGTEVLAPSSVSDRVKANIAAITVINEITADERAATASEQEVLAKWSGWGGAWQVFDTDRSEFATENAQLRALLGNDGYNTAFQSTINAHYTDPAIAAVIWGALQRAGLPDDATVLEPGCGSGHFIGHAPAGVHMVGVERDVMTAEIAHALYPESLIYRVPFQKVDAPDSVDASIGNVPFAELPVFDATYNPHGLRVHNYFIYKALAMTKPGGYVALITSTFTSDSRTQTRQALSELGDFLGGVRLPSNTFAAQAKTAVVTDLLVFRRREEGRAPSTLTKRWAAPLEAIDIAVGDDTESIRINPYFADNRDQILGTLSLGQGYRGRTQLLVRAGEEPLHQAIAARLDAIVDSAAAEDLGLSTDQPPNLAAKNVGIITPDDFAVEPVPGTLRFDETSQRFTQYELGRGWQAVKAKSAALSAEWLELLEIGDTVAKLISDEVQSTTPDVREKLRARLNDQYDRYVFDHGPINRFKWTNHASRNTDLQAAKKLDRLEKSWRAKNGGRKRSEDGKKWLKTPFTGEIPAQVIESLWDKAYIPDQKPYRKRAQLEGAIRFDPRIMLVRSIELFDDSTQTARKSTIFTEDINSARQRPERTDTVEDAVAVVLDECGEIDLARLAQLLDTDTAGAVVKARGLIYPDQLNPDRWIPAASALSGNIRTKLDHVRGLVAEDRDRWKPLQDALNEVLPAPVEMSKIKLRPGTPWFNHDYYRQFLAQEFGVAAIVVGYNADFGTWHFASNVTPRKDSWAVDGDKLTGIGLFERIANNQVIESRKTSEELEDSPKPLFHPERTAALRANAKGLEKRFIAWMWEDDDRAADLVDTFNRQFNCLVKHAYPTEHRTFPGLNPLITPYSYQVEAAVQAVMDGTILLDHVVGAGKTLTAAIICMEMRRLGMVKQPWIVVPNHLVGNWASEFRFAYPAANILVADELKDSVDRQRFVATTATNDFDVVIVPQSVFTLVGMSEEARADYLESEKQDLYSLFAHIEDAHPPLVKEVAKAIERLEARIDEITEKKVAREDKSISFEQSGCDYLVVDEAHLFKNLTRASKASDLTLTAGAQRASDMMMKIRYLREQSHQRNLDQGTPWSPARAATFATGTPIVNSIAELWVMTKYLRPDLLDDLRIGHIDAWATVFATMVTSIEMNVTATKIVTKSKLRDFGNMKQLRLICDQFTHTVVRSQIPKELPALVGGGHTLLEFPAAESIRDFLHDLEVRMRNRPSDRPDIDNPLKVGRDGTNVTIHAPLSGIASPPPENDRIALVAKRIRQIHEENSDFYLPADAHGPEVHGVLHLAFCDIGTPKPGDTPDDPSLYNYFRNCLVAEGFDFDEIAFIHDYPTTRDKDGLWRECNYGKINVLVGSTEKMGTGMNVQRRVRSLTHITLPQTPAAYEQRDGRAIRQGNRNKEVEIIDPIAIGSYDPVSHQLIEGKARFIERWREGNLPDSVEDIGASMEVSAAQAKAAATGDPLHMAVVEKENFVRELSDEQRAVDRVNRMNDRLLTKLEQQLPTLAAELEQAQATAVPLAEWSATDRASRRITIGGTEVADDDTDRLADATQKLLQREVIGLKLKRNTEAIPLFRIAGITLHGRRSMETGVLTVSVNDATWMYVEEEDYTAAMGSAVKAHGLLRRVRNMVEAVDTDVARLQRRIEDTQERVDALRDLPPRVFSRDDELSEARVELRDLEAEVSARENSPAALRLAEAEAERRAAAGQYPGFTLDLNPTPAHAERQEIPFNEMRKLVPTRMRNAAANWKRRERDRALNKASDPWQPVNEDGSEYLCGGAESSGKPGARALWNDRTWTWVAWDGTGNTVAGDRSQLHDAKNSGQWAARDLATASHVDYSGLYKLAGFNEKLWKAQWDLNHPPGEVIDAEVGSAIIDGVSAATAGRQRPLALAAQVGAVSGGNGPVVEEADAEVVAAVGD